MSETVPFDDWIRQRDNVRAASSRLGRSLFELPREVREPTEEERQAAHYTMVADKARARGRRAKNWRAKKGARK